MTYYEEFGVQPDARVEHIHVAYKTLVRLFHPDMQSDEAARCTVSRSIRCSEVFMLISQHVIHTNRHGFLIDQCAFRNFQPSGVKSAVPVK